MLKVLLRRIAHPHNSQQFMYMVERSTICVLIETSYFHVPFQAQLLHCWTSLPKSLFKVE